MKLAVHNIKMDLDESLAMVGEYAARKLGCSPSDFKKLKVIKESVDARKKNQIFFVYSVMVEIDPSVSITTGGDVKAYEEQEEVLVHGNEPLHERPLIVGAGPAGLFAGLLLAEEGFRPLIIERGDPVDLRTAAVERYWRTGQLDPESNVQFGEGGAGTFSDGKLTTRINDPRCDKVLAEFEKLGIDAETLNKAKPHIGTDKLKNVLVNLRKKIIEHGGEILFRSKMTDIDLVHGAIDSVTINGAERLPVSVVLLALGHSARDTFEMLFNKKINFTQKPFSVGCRIEHPQTLIDHARYGKFAGHKRLGAADYQLFQKIGERTAYSFCMCPGGIVVASASEPESIVTNGMSEFARDSVNANSAFVVSVVPDDYGSPHPLAGLYFQRKLEQAAFQAAGGNQSAPVQRLEDFVKGRVSKKIGTVTPSYTGQTSLVDLNRCLPDFVTAAMRGALRDFDRALNGFYFPDAILTGVETRTSSPVRINRDESYQALGFSGLYPVGEGAGYAGGIVSAAVDGLRCAEAVIRRYKPLY